MGHIQDSFHISLQKIRSFVGQGDGEPAFSLREGIVAEPWGYHRITEC